MKGTKRTREEACSLCNSSIKMFEVNANTSIAMCENTECVYPFNQPDVGGLIIETPQNDTRYSKKPKTQSSSVANTQPLKASDDDNCSVKSVEEFSLDDFDTSSFSMQTDGLTSLAVVGDEFPLVDLNNITQVPSVSSAVDTVPSNQSDANTTSNNFSLQDIEFLLTGDASSENEPTTEATATSERLSPTPSVNVNLGKNSSVSVDCSSPTSPNVNTPKDDTNLNWIEDFDVLFGDDMAQSKFNPLDGDTEFDSVLGI